MTTTIQEKKKIYYTQINLTTKIVYNVPTNMYVVTLSYKERRKARCAQVTNK